MDWIKQLNESIEYIESNLDKVISHQELANIMLCSFDNYQKVFFLYIRQDFSPYMLGKKINASWH